MLVQPGAVGLVGAEEISGETESIDAEAVAFITGSADEPHPLICEQKVVRLARPRVVARIPDVLGTTQRQISGLQSVRCRCLKGNNTGSQT